MKKLLVSAFMLALLIVFGCKKEEVQVFDCTGLTPTYTSDIKAILDANCNTSGCHDVNTVAGNIDLSTYANAKTESEKERFLGSIQHKSGYRAMPDNEPKLSDALIQKISCWVQNGSPQ